MTRRWIWLLASVITAACGSVDSADNRGEPIATVVAALESAPTNLPSSNLRATLVWLNTPPFGGVDCHDDVCDTGPRSFTVLTTSDVEVEMSFPLTVRIGMFELPEPLTNEYPGYVGTGNGRLHLTYNSVPEAEVVLYEDGNHNQRLDLLAPGEPGPGPDRVIALSSGIDAQGNAVRTAIVNKRSPVPAGFASDGAFSLEAFAFPLPKALDPEGMLSSSDALFSPPGTPAPPVYADGVYTLRFSAAADAATAVQQAVLKAHNLIDDPLTSDAALLTAAQLVINPVGDKVVQLFAVGAEDKSWLARACNPFPQRAVAYMQPPPGSEVQCGASALRFATNPGDYCGFARTVDITQVQLNDTSWWPCGDQGLKAGTGYSAAETAIEIDLRHNYSIVGEEHLDMLPTERCDAGQLVHADASIGLHMPTAAPPAGSQVLCYGSDALSFIPAHTNGCAFKYTYDLAMPAADGGEGPHWDLRAQPPAWWPCDGAGALRSGTPYVPANIAPATSCPAPRTVLWWGMAPGHAQVRCESALAFEYRPVMSDGCSTHRFTRQNSQLTDGVFPAGETWPCDDEGHFIPGRGFLPWE